MVAWTIFSKLFVKADGSPVAQVPESCIESAEYVIQCISKNSLISWTKAGEARTPHVLAKFGDSKSINISDTADFQNDAVGMKDYPFTALPAVGQGLICINKTSKDLHYNMHLGAVVAAGSGKVLITNMMEKFNSTVTLVDLETAEIDGVEAFRSGTFGSGAASNYALGLLST